MKGKSCTSRGLDFRPCWWERWREGGVKRDKTNSSGSIHSFHCPWKRSFFPLAPTATGATVFFQLLKEWGQVPLLMQIPWDASCHSQYGQLHFHWKKHREPRWAQGDWVTQEMEFSGSDCEMLLGQWRGTAHMDPPNQWIAPVVFHWKDAGKFAQCRFPLAMLLRVCQHQSKEVKGKFPFFLASGGTPCFPPLSSRLSVKGKKTLQTIFSHYIFKTCLG